MNSEAIPCSSVIYNLNFRTIQLVHSMKIHVTLQSETNCGQKSYLKVSFGIQSRFVFFLSCLCWQLSHQAPLYIQFWLFSSMKLLCFADLRCRSFCTSVKVCYRYFSSDFCAYEKIFYIIFLEFWDLYFIVSSCFSMFESTLNLLIIHCICGDTLYHQYMNWKSESLL
jgi:hypothetical protein